MLLSSLSSHHLSHRSSVLAGGKFSIHWITTLHPQTWLETRTTCSFVHLEKLLLCNSSWLGISYAAQAGLNLKETLLLQLSSAEIIEHHVWPKYVQFLLLVLQATSLVTAEVYKTLKRSVRENSVSNNWQLRAQWWRARATGKEARLQHATHLWKPPHLV